MPHVKRIEGPKGNAIYQVGGKSFVFFRTPQPDAVDADTGEKFPDVLMIWVETQADKLSLTQDPARRSSPPNGSTTSVSSVAHQPNR